MPACSAIGELQSDEALVRRIAELEEDRFALQAEVEFTRTQLAEQTKLLFDERRLAADERASWASEMRLLREAIHRQMDTSPAHRIPPTRLRQRRRSSAFGRHGEPRLQRSRAGSVAVAIQNLATRRRAAPRLGEKKPE